MGRCGDHCEGIESRNDPKYRSGNPRFVVTGDNYGGYLGTLPSTALQFKSTSLIIGHFRSQRNHGLGGFDDKRSISNDCETFIEQNRAPVGIETNRTRNSDRIRQYSAVATEVVAIGSCQLEKDTSCHRLPRSIFLSANTKQSL